MTVIKSGDLVMLKSGGPTMTVDTVNTDILDDNKITGVLCVWFVGENLSECGSITGLSSPYDCKKPLQEKKERAWRKLRVITRWFLMRWPQR